MNRWAIYYDDGTRFSHEDGTPNESPPFGALMVSQPDVMSPKIVAGGEPYFVHRTDMDQWVGSDLAGLLDQLSHFAPYIDCVRVGRWVRTPEWKELNDLVKARQKAGEV